MKTELFPFDGDVLKSLNVKSLSIADSAATATASSVLLFNRSKKKPQDQDYESPTTPLSLEATDDTATSDDCDSVPIRSSSVEQILKERIDCCILFGNDGDDSASHEEENAFFVADLGHLKRQLRRWRQHLPRIEPFYAVKCNPEPAVLETMADMGVSFDCASRLEIQTILNMGVEADRIVYANPCKQSSHIKHAATMNVSLMTFDNADELYKVKRLYPDARLILRVLTDDSRSVCKLGSKFGAWPDVTRSLIALAKELELNLVGVSFHVGSGCFDAMAFREAVQTARKVFDEAAEYGYELEILDVGGGFPGSDFESVSFECIAKVLGAAVDEYFGSEVRVIAEPGRYFVAGAFTLATHITARRAVDDKYMVYINDGVYGSFNCILFDHAVVEPKVLCTKGDFVYDQRPCGELVKVSIWGPTCDSMDCISKACSLPEVDVGDWLYFDNMGAYTLCAASTFNGFNRSDIVFTNTESATGE